MEMRYFIPQIIEIAVVGTFEYFEIFFQGTFACNK